MFGQKSEESFNVETHSLIAPTFDQSTYHLGDIDDYTLISRIGRGKYSNVFLGHDQFNNKITVKILKPVRQNKIDREIMILQKLRGSPYITQLLDVVRDPDSGSISLILSWTENSDIRKVINEMTLTDISIYIFKLLTAVQSAHSQFIMHRDIKPGNIIYNHTTKDLCLIDWGLASFYQPGESYQVRVATKHYKGPELLLGFSKYTTSLDIWCCGCTMAGLIFKRIPFFRGKDNDDQIVKMSKILGGSKMLKYCEDYNLKLSDENKVKIQNENGKGWEELLQQMLPQVEYNTHYKVTFDLLSQMLQIDHTQRPTASSLLYHPFFNNIHI